MSATIEDFAAAVQADPRGVRALLAFYGDETTDLLEAEDVLSLAGVHMLQRVLDPNGERTMPRLPGR